MYMMLDRSKAKLIRQRSHAMTVLYGSAVFSDSKDVIRLYSEVACLPIPPVVAK